MPITKAKARKRSWTSPHARPRVRQGILAVLVRAKSQKQTTLLTAILSVLAEQTTVKSRFHDAVAFFFRGIVAEAGWTRALIAEAARLRPPPAHPHLRGFALGAIDNFQMRADYKALATTEASGYLMSMTNAVFISGYERLAGTTRFQFNTELNTFRINTVALAASVRLFSKQDARLAQVGAHRPRVRQHVCCALLGVSTSIRYEAAGKRTASAPGDHKIPNWTNLSGARARDLWLACRCRHRDGHLLFSEPTSRPASRLDRGTHTSPAIPALQRCTRTCSYLESNRVEHVAAAASARGAAPGCCDGARIGHHAAPEGARRGGASAAAVAMDVRWDPADEGRGHGRGGVRK